MLGSLASEEGRAGGYYERSEARRSIRHHYLVYLSSVMTADDGSVIPDDG